MMTLTDEQLAVAAHQVIGRWREKRGTMVELEEMIRATLTGWTTAAAMEGYEEGRADEKEAQHDSR